MHQVWTYHLCRSARSSPERRSWRKIRTTRMSSLLFLSLQIFIVLSLCVYVCVCAFFTSEFRSISYKARQNWAHFFQLPQPRNRRISLRSARIAQNFRARRVAKRRRWTPGWQHVACFAAGLERTWRFMRNASKCTSPPARSTSSATARCTSRTRPCCWNLYEPAAFTSDRSALGIRNTSILHKKY